MIVPFVLAVDFMNFTYATNPCAANVPVPAVMRRGSFSYFDRKMAAGFDLHVASIAKGSLQAGTGQAVVVLTCDFPVGGTAAAYPVRGAVCGQRLRETYRHDVCAPRRKAREK